MSSDVTNIVSAASLTHFLSAASAVAEEGLARKVTSTIGGTPRAAGEYVAVNPGLAHRRGCSACKPPVEARRPSRVQHQTALMTIPPLKPETTVAYRDRMYVIKSGPMAKSLCRSATV